MGTLFSFRAVVYLERLFAFSGRRNPDFLTLNVILPKRFAHGFERRVARYGLPEEPPAGGPGSLRESFRRRARRAQAQVPGQEGRDLRPDARHGRPARRAASRLRP